jgi:hypothetical protein
MSGEFETPLMNAETKERTGKNTLLLKVAVLFVIVAAGGAVFLYYHRDWNAPAAAKNLHNPVPATDQSIAMGMRNYSTHCQNCHGDRGDGKGPRADSLSIAPSDYGCTCHGFSDGWRAFLEDFPWAAADASISGQTYRHGALAIGGFHPHFCAKTWRDAWYES